jgi:hypothetical protein
MDAQNGSTVESPGVHLGCLAARNVPLPAERDAFLRALAGLVSALLSRGPQQSGVRVEGIADAGEGNGVVSAGGDWIVRCEGWRTVNRQSNAAKSTARRLWLWPIAILLGFPIGGLLADLAMDGVDSVGSALVEGLIAGVIVGAAEWFALRRWVSWLWIPATCVGIATGLTAGAALVHYGIGRGDLALMGAVTGLGVGVFQALVLVQAGHSISNAIVWAVANPPAWALGWFITSYVIARNIGERYPIFGASGAVVFGLLTWLLLAALIRRASETQGPRNATAR